VFDTEPNSPTATDPRVDSVTTADLSATCQPAPECHSDVSTKDAQTVTGSLPRSRTFSNLPLPTRLRKPSQTLLPSRSTIRMPSLPLIGGHDAGSKHKISE
jgi:hypothetical protein